MASPTRRELLEMIVAAGAVAATGCAPTTAERARAPRASAAREQDAPADVVLATAPLGMPWETRDPFLMCVHHDDRYPAGDARMGPAASLEGRQLGRDFEGRDGWRMYHGEVVPGFPQHPHRGFETVTVVRNGLLDHSDSMGAAARYGRGDVQWLTAGRGIQHAEMFPLLEREAPNPLELFQIWLNLPHVDKMVEPHFTMLWGEDIPRHVAEDDAGRTTEVTLVACRLGDVLGAPPPPSSWAARASSDVAIWTIRMEPRARFVLPAAMPGSNRDAYFFAGDTLRVGGRELASGRRIELRAERDAVLENGDRESELLLLQGQPIAEPIARHGPFVMSSEQEIRQAYADYRATQFGGWPWDRRDPVHAREEGRFARHADGRIDRRG